jgi:peptidoglycan/LPS O-acetylase OafA/YrhL
VSAPLLVAILLTVIMVAPITRFWIGGVGSFAYTFCRADAVLIGVLLAWLYRRSSFIEFLKQNRGLCWSILSIAILLTSFLPLIAYNLGGVGNHFWFAGLYGVFLIFIVVFSDSYPTRVMRQRWLVWLGNRSYCIYLFHQAVSGLLHGAVFAAAPRIGSPYEFAVTVMALVVVLYLASLSYRYIELPILSFGRKFAYANDPLAVSGRLT